jgi:WD40 repeat protein
VVAVSANGGWLAWGNGDNRIRLLELSGNDPSSMFSAHEAPIVALAFTPDAHALASVDTDGWLIRSTLPNSDAKFASRKNSGRFRVRALAFAPDGKRLYGAGANGEVYCWDAITLDLIKPMLGK